MFKDHKDHKNHRSPQAFLPVKQDRFFLGQYGTVVGQAYQSGLGLGIGSVEKPGCARPLLAVSCGLRTCLNFFQCAAACLGNPRADKGDAKHAHRSKDRKHGILGHR